MATNLLLLLAAVVLALFLFPLGMLFTFWWCVVRWSGRKTIGYLSNTAYTLAYAIDCLGNVVCRDLFDTTLRYPNGYPFGRFPDTISRVLGINKRLNTLTDAGRALANFLNRLDKEHVEKASSDYN